MKKIITFIGLTLLFSCEVEETESVKELNSIFFKDVGDDHSFNPALINGIPEENKKLVYYTDFSKNKEEWPNEEEVVKDRYPLIHDKDGYFLSKTIEVSEIDAYTDYEIQFNIELLDLTEKSNLGLIFESIDEKTYKFNLLMLSNLLEDSNRIELLYIDSRSNFIEYATDIDSAFSAKNWGGMITLRKHGSDLYFFVNKKLMIQMEVKVEYYGNKFGFYIANLSNAWLLDYKVSLIVQND